MRKIIVMTDLHIVEEGGRIGHLDPAERLTRGLAHALENQPDAEAIVLTGDLTHHGRPAQYARLAEVLRDVPVPVHPMIGNHDRRAAFCRGFPDAPVTDEGFVQRVVDCGGDRLVLLDTLDEDAEPDHSGWLCPARLGWLERALKEAEGRRVTVFTHHPLVPVGFEAMDRIGLRNRVEMLDRLRAHGVAQIVSGHVHRTISGSAGGIPMTVLKGTCHQSPMMRPEMDSDASVDEPGAYGILYLGPEAVIVHSEDFDVPGRRELTYS